MKDNILIIVGGNIKKIDAFKKKASMMKLKVTTASFSDINYVSFGKKKKHLYVGKKDVADFSTVYIRMVGKRLEDASLLATYAYKHGVRVVDNVYQKETLLPSSVAKSIETKKLIDKDIPLPRTIYGSVPFVFSSSAKEFGYPFIVKSTSGRKAREAWIVDNEVMGRKLKKELEEKEKGGMRFFGQEFIMASQRIRLLVIDGKVIAAITRPTKWRKRIKSKQCLDNPEGVKGALKPIPNEYISYAIKATKAVDLDIAGVDILQEDDGGKCVVIEVNAAPAWKLIEKDTNIDVETKILQFLSQ